MRIGILGYGRFGRALGALLREAGHSYQAWDPVSEIPVEHRAAGVRDLVEAHEGLVLAVPVPALGDVLRGLRPHLRPEHLAPARCWRNTSASPFLTRAPIHSSDR